jgi:hypothetical protein
MATGAVAVALATILPSKPMADPNDPDEEEDEDDQPMR